MCSPEGSNSQSYRVLVHDGYEPYMKALGIPEPRRKELMETAQTAYDELNGAISTQDPLVKLRLLHNKILPEIKGGWF